jgi:hypothetical protein
MKVNFKTTNKKISFDTNKQGRPPKTTEKTDKVKNVFFTQTELTKLIALQEEKYTNLSFSMFIKELIKKGQEC